MRDIHCAKKIEIMQDIQTEQIIKKYAHEVNNNNISSSTIKHLFP